MLTIASISVSRLMLSIHSLADHLGTEDSWLLNFTELSRVHWKEGVRKGEIIVEVNHQDDVELGSLDYPTNSTRVALKTTRIGMSNDPSQTLSGPTWRP